MNATPISKAIAISDADPANAGESLDDTVRVVRPPRDAVSSWTGTGVFGAWDDTADRDRPRPTVAIVGGGPRALWAIDALRSHGSDPVRVTVFEPHAHPGAGPVYDPSQPDYIRMNFAASKIDVTGGSQTFLDWAGSSGRPPVSEDEYAPRSVVGEYLARQFRERLNAEHPVGCEVVSEIVRSVNPDGGRFAVHTGSGVYWADAVLLATGHRLNPADHANASDVDGCGSAPRPGATDRLAAYPTRRLQKRLSGVGPDDAVDVRGLSLTFIDVALTLTEGRGGMFRRDGNGFRYAPSGREPGRIHGWSRTGRLMTPKPRQAVFDRLAPSTLEIDRWGDRLENGASRGPLTAVLTEVLTEVAEEIRRRGGGDAGEGDAAGWLADCDEGADPAECLATSNSAARGTEPPDWPLAFGVAWRLLYPRLISLVSHRRWSARDAAAFRELAGQMERVGFGPPLRNSERIEALLDGGFLTVGRESASDAAVRVEGRIAPIDPGSDPLLGPLVRQGTLSIDAHFGCVRVDPALGVLDGRGRIVDGLSVFGRATEGVVLGNDTLSRSDHRQIDRWAARTLGLLRLERAGRR